MSDPEIDRLTRAAIRGDRHALTSLWRQQRRLVAAVLLAHMPRDSEIEDLMQEVAVKVCEHIGGLRDSARFLPWLRSIAVNTARSAGRGVRIAEDLGRAPEDAIDPRTTGDSIGRRDLIDLVLGLPPEYREPLVMKSVRGLSQRVIAAALGVPETTIETRLVRARRLLRERMQAPPARAREAPSRAATSEPT